MDALTRAMELEGIHEDWLDDAERFDFETDALGSSGE